MDKLNALWQQWIAGPIDPHTDLWGIHVFWLARIGILMQLIGIAMIVIHAQRETFGVQILLAKSRAHAAPLHDRSPFYVYWYSYKPMFVWLAVVLPGVLIFVFMALFFPSSMESVPGWVGTIMLGTMLIFSVGVFAWWIYRQSRVAALGAEEDIKNFAIVGWPLLVLGTILLALGR